MELQIFARLKPEARPQLNQAIKSTVNSQVFTYILLACIFCLISTTSGASSPQMNSIELQVDDNSTTASQSPGETILEDLVNQFFEKNKESVRQGKAEQHNDESNDESLDHSTAINHQLPMMNESVEDLQTMANNELIANQAESRRLFIEQAESSQNDSINNQEMTTTVHLTASTPLPYMHLIAMSSNRPTTTIETTEDGDVLYGESADSTGGQRLGSMISMQAADEADRHIQYDVIQSPQPMLHTTTSKVTIAATTSNLQLNQNYSNSNTGTLNHLPLFNYEKETLANNETSIDTVALNAPGSNSSTRQQQQQQQQQGEKLNDGSVKSNELPATNSTNDDAQSNQQQVTLNFNLTERFSRATNSPESSNETNLTNLRIQTPVAQARSMSSLLLNHSKAPYASSYLQNHQQSRTVIGSQEPPSARQLDAIGNQAANRRDSASERSQTIAPPSSKLPDTQTVSNSTVTLAPTIMTTPAIDAKKSEQDYLSSGQQSQLQKLANSINRYVELEPIPLLHPSSSGATNLASDSAMLDELPSRYFDSTEYNAFGALGGPNLQNSISTMGQQAAATTTTTATTVAVSGQPRDSTRVSYPTKVAHDFKATEQSSPLSGKPTVDSLQQQQQPLPLVSLQRKTFESVGNQLQNSERNYAELGSNLDSTHRQAPVLLITSQSMATGNGNSFNHRNGHTHFAASLVNVTAPMTPPISATEAMESSLGQQAAKNLLHQASGFLGHSNPSLSAGVHFVNDTSTTNRAASNNNNNNNNMRTPTTTTQTMNTHSSIAKINQQQLSQGTTSQPRVYSSQPANYFASSLPLNNQEQKPSLVVNPIQYNMLQTNGNSFMDNSQEPTQPSMSDSMRTRYTEANLYTQRSPSSFAEYLPQNHTQASGFRSPGYLSSQHHHSTSSTHQPGLFHSSNGFNGNSAAANHHHHHKGTTLMPQLMPPTMEPLSQTSTTISPLINHSNSSTGSGPSSVTNGFITGSAVAQGSMSQQQVASSEQSSLVLPSNSNGNVIPQTSDGIGKKVFNLTRVEHISAECSNDLIRTVIIFNGTFRGIIYSSGYVRDPNCLYINGTGKTRYDFSIRLNQCGTLGKQELHPPSGPNEVRRRDQLMWNTLSIQYNPIIEQEWDEHFRVSCEYGSDFWKTISFSPFNVETNTGSPVVFTVDPPKCQMEILRGHGMVGPRQEAISGPVTVGDPLTLLIHMKSEKAGYDILVKNCVAHNGGNQRMQLIDSNGCVVNERFISPFRGTYNDNDLKHVTLFSYLKAFRFTGKSVLYLECEVHMCQTSCPPQMCYWRRLSKRSANETEADFGDQEFNTNDLTPAPATTLMARQSRKFTFNDNNEENLHHNQASRSSQSNKSASETLSDSLSLFQALEVLTERAIDSPYSSSYKNQRNVHGHSMEDDSPAINDSSMCYQRAEVFAFLFTTGSALVAAISIAIGCCWRTASLTRATRRLNERKRLHNIGAIY